MLSLICEDFIYKVSAIFIFYLTPVIQTGAEVKKDAQAIADGKLVFRLCTSF
ncbi:hypothetical protein [Nostoc sp.]|uniref:hypothetical protein n=1 Tax=Nostoc sp. TaxID=1180 RepID=UPI002FF8334B